LKQYWRDKLCVLNGSHIHRKPWCSPLRGAARRYTSSRQHQQRNLTQFLKDQNMKLQFCDGWKAILLESLMIGTLLSCETVRKDATAPDEQAIRAMYDRYSVAVRSRNVDTIMAFYASDDSFVAFDAFPPRQYLGAVTYRKAYEGFFAAYPGPVTSEISDLRITTDGTLGFASTIDRWVATGSDGKPTEVIFRVTNGLRKINGKWLIVHEHVSVPVDPVTGIADFL